MFPDLNTNHLNSGMITVFVFETFQVIKQHNDSISEF